MTLSLGARGPAWGHGGDPDPICGFESPTHFRRSVTEFGTRTGFVPLCHQT